MSQQKRASFGGKLSAILVAAGSAIGLGSIWRFPYMAGEHGGAAFMLVYLLCVFVVGIPVMLGEFAVGRKTKMNAVGGFRSLSRPWRWLGYNGVIGALFISGYYYIVAGWSLEYMVSSFTGSLYSSPDSFTDQFSSFQASWRQVFYTFIFILLTHLIIIRGVEKGIEKASNIMMPILFVILLLMAVRVAFMPGAAEGYKFMFTPRWEALANPMTWVWAMGQAFFSLSLGLGCLCTYASYFGNDTNIGKTALNVALIDTFVAVMAGLIIFPACFTYNLEVGAGPGLLFDTMASVFNNMAGGRIWGSLFFIFWDIIIVADMRLYMFCFMH